MRISRDIETEVYTLLTDDGYSASAHRIPASLSESLPHVHVVRTGGYTSDLVIETINVDFDVYAEDEADATEEACALCGWVRDLTGTGTYYRAEITTLPYNNPDPRHPTVARVTFKAQLITRTKGA